MSLVFLQSGANFSPTNSSSLLAFLVVRPGHDFVATQQAFLEQNSNLSKLPIETFFVTDLAEPVEENNFLLDENFTFFKQLKSDFNGRNGEPKLLFVQKDEENEEWKLLAFRENLETEIDWSKIVEQFVYNYQKTEADEENYWRWGQIVPETAMYLCKDCGYTEEFEAGTVFPICEVCLSGDPTYPSGYAGPGEGFWEKI